MSVRRLADDAIQPDRFALNRAFGAEAKKWIKKYPKGREASAVIPLLMLAQEQEGWVTRAAIENVAQMLEMPLIRVLEVATFYTQFQLAPVGSKAHIQICGTTPCMLRGSEGLIALCRKKINPEPFHTNEAGTLSWEEVECQGACVNAPMVMIHKDTYEDLTAERLEEIIDAFEAGKGDTIEPGPQIERIYSAPAGGLTSLTDEASIKSSSSKGKTGKKGGGDEPHVPPAEAARPDPEAIETAPAVKSPGSRNPDVASGKKQSGKKASGKKTAKSANPTLKVAGSAKAVRPKKGGKRKVSEGNPTVRIAATASGRAVPASDKDRPKGIEKPSQVDDLKLISGVGPKIERVLNGLGIYKFEQIAHWKKAEREWVDDHLKFKGRIERDDWVKQAKALAKGGREEYVKVFGKEPR